MLVYGDEVRDLATRDLVAALVAGASTPLAGDAVDRHPGLVATLIGLSGLLQGVADAEFAENGRDDMSVTQNAIMQLLLEVAAGVTASWRGDGVAEVDLSALDRLDLPTRITVRRCEGYAFYALYPELYAAAAQHISAGAVVIGLRSIGTGLAAIVASACNAAAVFTVRPVGPPFERTVNVGPALTELVADHHTASFVLVDEGPGLSGSSLNGVADWLESQGVAASRIVFQPSHAGPLGSHASTAHRTRWAQARRLVASFDEEISPRLLRWFQPWTGVDATLRDLSGGQWRKLLDQPDLPADPAREARKYLIEGENGRFVARFVGLDDAGQGAFDHARILHAAGFGAEPVALRHGFLLQRFVDGVPLARNTPNMTPALASYLMLRATQMPARQGASTADLVAMARQNIAEALGDGAAILFNRWTDERVAAVQAQVRAVHVDARMHAWEWLATSAGPVKTDALAHGRAHDLVGAQDIAWDVAGALVEFDLSQTEQDHLIDAVLGTERADLLGCMRLCYLAFQIGWWSFSSDRSAAAQLSFYIGQVRQLLHQTGHRLA